MLKKLEVLEDKYKELTEKISDPEIINDQKASFDLWFDYFLKTLARSSSTIPAKNTSPGRAR